MFLFFQFILFSAVVLTTPAHAQILSNSFTIGAVSTVRILPQTENSTERFTNSFNNIGDIDNDGIDEYLFGTADDLISLAFFDANGNVRNVTNILNFQGDIRFGRTGTRLRFPDNNPPLLFAVGAPRNLGRIEFFALTTSWTVTSPQSTFLEEDLVNPILSGRVGFGRTLKDLDNFDNDADANIATINNRDTLYLFSVTPSLVVTEMANITPSSAPDLNDIIFDFFYPIGRFNPEDDIGDIVIGSPFTNAQRGAICFVFLTANGGISSTLRLEGANFDINNVGGFGSAFSIAPQTLATPQTLVSLVGVAYDGVTRDGTVGILLSSRDDVRQIVNFQQVSIGLSPFSGFGSGDSVFHSFNESAGTITLLAVVENDPQFQRSSIHLVTVSICGNGLDSNGSKACDDGNNNDGDGCSRTCTIDAGWQCSGFPSQCSPICGDGVVIAGFEECDDANTLDEDGCSPECVLNTMNSTSLNSAAVASSAVLVSLACCLLLVGLVVAFLYFHNKAEREVYKQQVELAKRLNIKTISNVVIGKEIGSGEFGNVYRGEWEHNVVALKSIKGRSLEDFANELAIAIDMRHPNVVQFYGLYVRGSENFLVYEYMNKKSLLSVLHSDPEISVLTLFKFCVDIAQGMAYIHSQEIIHRDLSCRNILVATQGASDAFFVKIGDFGLSRKSENYYRSESALVPVRWAAPEVIEFGKSSMASDVWSFGVVLWEIFARGATPYSGFEHQEIFELIKKGERLAAPADMPVIIEDMMITCNAYERDKRPTFKALCQAFEVAQQGAKIDIKSRHKTIFKANDIMNQTTIQLDIRQLQNENQQLKEQISRMNQNLQNYDLLSEE